MPGPFHRPGMHSPFRGRSLRRGYMAEPRPDPLSGMISEWTRFPGAG